MTRPHPIRRIGLLLSVIAQCATTPFAAASPAFNPSKLIVSPTSMGETVQHDQQSVAGDGNGRWIVVWSALRIYPVSPSSEDWDHDVLLSTSSDGGRTWTDPATLGADVDASGAAPIKTDKEPVITTDRSGLWIAAWNREGDIVLSKSHDNGATWDAPVTLASPGDSLLDLATDGQGNWVLAAATSAGMSRIRSSDNGATWSTLDVIETPPIVGASFQIEVTVNSSGQWIIVWSRQSDHKVFAAASNDDGDTWSSTSVLDSGEEFFFPSVSIDPNGHALAVWESFERQADVRVAESFDGGITWSAPRVLLAHEPYFLFAKIRHEEGGRWSVAGVGRPAVRATSLDDGATWSEVSPINRDSVIEESWGQGIDFETDGAGGWMAVWRDANQFGAYYDNRRGLQYDSLMSATSNTRCPAEPREDCFTTSSPGLARLEMRNRKLGLRGNSLKWSWSSEAPASVADFGNPLLGDSYELCIYETVATDYRLASEISLNTETDCLALHCWSANSGGFGYRDPSGLSGTLRSALLRAKTDQSKLVVKAGGVWLEPFHLPAQREPEVRVQLQGSGSTACWDSVFRSPSTDTSTRFRSESE